MQVPCEKGLGRSMLVSMGWASHYIEKLQKGKTVSFRPMGASMRGKVNSGDLCTVVPIGDRAVHVGDIVLCTVKGRQYLHLVKALRHGEYQIGNNRGGINGWTRSIHGLCISVQP